MKIILDDYKVGIPVRVTKEYDPKSLDMEFVDLKYTCGIKLDGIVEKGEDTVHFQGHLTSEVDHICGRCLKSVADKVNYPFNLFYEIKGKKEVQTLQDIRELMILEHPISYVCGPECRGLCPHCGINLNESTCNCNPSVQKDSFSALKNIRVKRKEE